jgi:hypothetical protein
MKHIAAVLCFSFGSLGSVGAWVWFVAALASHEPIWPFPSDIRGIEVLFALWGTVMFATFYRSPLPIWAPLFEVSDGRTRVARLILTFALINCLVWLVTCVVVWIIHNQGRLPWTFSLLASGVLLLNALYVVVHWAFRPENLFSEKFRRFADDPIVFLIFDPILKRRKLK